METGSTSTLGMRIAHLRTKHNLSQKTLGEKIGVGHTTISNYENGYSTPGIEELKQLSKIFEVDYSYFIDGTSPYDEKIMQSGIIINRIPFYNPTNTNGIITGDIKLADSYVSLPSDTAIDSDKYICTKAIDNSMSNIGITNNSYVIINKIPNVTSGDIVAIYDTSKKTFIIRKYINDGPMALYISDGHDGTQTICANINDNEYSIIGKVEKAIINL